METGRLQKLRLELLLPSSGCANSATGRRLCVIEAGCRMPAERGGKGQLENGLLKAGLPGWQLY
jgi:hypothetical protein